MRIFYGAAIQGGPEWGGRPDVNRALLDCIRTAGHQVVSEHTTGRTREEVLRLMEASIGPLPPNPAERWIHVRRKMIAGVEGAIEAAVFEVSIPSLGTGIEVAHAYLRPRLGLSAIPVLALYERNFWPHDLSTMIRGITPAEAPQFQLWEYETIDEAGTILNEFLRCVGT